MALRLVEVSLPNSLCETKKLLQRKRPGSTVPSIIGIDRDGAICRKTFEKAKPSDQWFQLCCHFGNEKCDIRADNHMEISFRNRILAKGFSSERTLRREYGASAARIIMIRLAVLLDAETLSEAPATPPDRMHQLAGNRDEQYAVYLVHPCRLVFVPAHDPLPRKEDDGIVLDQVKAITVMEVVDYH